MKNKKNKIGFTLIELLVAITIGMVVISLATVSLNSFNEKQKVEAVRQELLANLRLARNYAITNQFPPESSSDTDRVAVSIDVDGLVVIGAQTSGNVDTGYIFSSKDITPKGVVITSPIIRFSITDGRSIGGDVEIEIVGDTSDNDQKTIKIDSSGLIYEYE